MSTSRRVLGVICGLALLTGLTVPVLAWHYPDAGIPKPQNLPDVAPPAPDRGEAQMLDAIWTTLTGCNKADAQDVNQYLTGDTVHVRAVGFGASECFDWTITGKPGGASCDPEVVVANGHDCADASGYACVDAYMILADDCGEYSVDMGGKNDNYSVGSAGVRRLDLSKTGDESVCYSDQDQTANYGYTVTNNGTVDLYNVQITDDPACTIDTGDRDLAANGGSATFSAPCTIPGGTVGSLTNTATATANTEDDDTGETITSNQARWTVTIEQCCALVVTVAPETAELNCNNEHTVQLTATPENAIGTVTYQWYEETLGELTGKTSETLDVTAPGSYYVVATDNGAAECSADSNSVVVTEYDDPTVSVLPTSGELNCNVDTVTLTATGSGGKGELLYQWYNLVGPLAGETGQTLDVTAAGTYSVTVTDANQCSAESSPVVVTEYDDPTVSVSPRSGELNCNVPTITLTATGSGGKGELLYQWYDLVGPLAGETGQTLDVTAAGTYSVTVTDENGCEGVSNSVVVTSSVQLTVLASLDSQDECTGEACFSALASGGTGTYTYTWDLDNDGQFDDGAGGKACHVYADGTHTVKVRVTDGVGCQAIDDIQIIVAVPAEVDITKTVDQSSVPAGTTVTYGYYITNTSACPLLDVTLSDDKIPSVDEGILGGLTDEDDDGAADDLAPSASASGSVDQVITASTHNCATVTAKNALGATASAQDCADVTVMTVTPCITLVKDGPATAYQGDVVEYTFVVQNCSTDAWLYGVTVTDPMFPTWGPTDLAPGEQIASTISYTIPVESANPLCNVATASGTDALSTTWTYVDDHCIDILQPGSCIDLQKSGPAKANEGELINYDFTLTNCGSSALTNVTVTDTLLGGVIWGPGALAPLESLTFAVLYQVPWDTASPLINEARAEGTDPAGVKISDTASWSVIVLRPLGFKFWDQNWDGTRQQAEPLMGGWEIWLENVRTGERYTVWTNNSLLGGHYGEWFPPPDLPGGLYDVYEGHGPAWTQTYPSINGGRYRIDYSEDGTFGLLSPPPDPYYGLSFGNAAVVTGCPCFDWVVFQSNRDGNWELYGVSSFGGQPLRLTNNLAVDTAPAVSRATKQEDTRIAFQSNRNGKWDIFRMDTDGLNLVQLTFGSAADRTFNNTDPVWAPVCDVQKLAFVSDRDDNEEIYLMNADGSGQQRLTDSSFADTDPDWAPTGEAVVFQSMRNGNWDIYRVDITGNNLLQLTDSPYDDVDPVWSPDGNWIAFRSNRDGTWQTYVVPATGGAAVRLSAGSGDNLQAVWSPNSEQLAYQSNRDGNWEIYVVNLATRVETRVTNDAAKSQAPTWSCTSDSVVYQTDADGNWELYHVATTGGLPLARVTNNLATDVYPAWVPGEEDSSLSGLDIPMPTPVPTATPLPTATPTQTPTPTQTLPPPTATPTQTITRYWLYLPLLLRAR